MREHQRVGAPPQSAEQSIQSRDDDYTAKPQSNQHALRKLYGSQRLMVEGGSDLLKRINNSEKIAEIFVYTGDVRVFNEMPRGSNNRMAVLALPKHVSPAAVNWPVEGYEIFVVANEYGPHAIRLLVSELFSYGAIRVSVNIQIGTRIEHHGVYASPEVDA